MAESDKNEDSKELESDILEEDDATESKKDDVKDTSASGGSKKKSKKSAKSTETKPADTARRSSSRQRGGLPTPAWIAICVVALFIGLAVGHFFIGGSMSAVGSTTVEESKLDDTIATYTYDGESYDVTIREVLEENGDVSSQANDDGTYDVPTTDTVVSYIRNEIVLKEASNQGITATDEEVAAYSESMLGSSDYATIGSNYNMDEESTKALLTDATIMKKLRDSVVTTEVGDAPTAPEEPEDGNEDTTNETYAQYIINLLGDEWDSENNTWARTDGTYYSTLSSYEISNDSASYAAALQAYYVAYSNYYTASSEASSEWTAYVNTLLDGATVQVSTLAV